MFKSLPTRRRLSCQRLFRACAPSLLLVAVSLVVMSADSPAQKKGARRAQARPAAKTGATTTTAKTPAGSITVKTEPKAVVWLDELRRGVTDDSGQLTIKNVGRGAHSLRVRAKGFRERTLAVAASQRGTIQVALTPTTDEAELLFQQAEEAAERGGESRQQAIELYRAALKARAKFPAAHVGLARVLLATDQFDAALEEIAAARRLRPAYAEASAVEGRVLRELAEYDEAVEAYRRAIREGRGVQPEAHTGLAIVLADKGDHDAAVDAYRKAIAQLSDTEPALYQLLGATYEKLERWKEALAAYEKYLELAPEGRLAPAIRSIIDQLRQQAAEQQEATTPQ